MTDIGKLLAERGKRYGEFDRHAEITQDLKGVISHHVLDLDRRLDPDMTEALEMICHKIGRIINGDPSYEDSWRDVAGYATLVADRLLRDQNSSPFD